MINAGLVVDLPHIEDTGCGRHRPVPHRTAIHGRQALPRANEQLALYRAVLDAAGDKPVTFRTLDIGGDKALPYLETVVEENPALGWRAIRLGLDRPGLLRSQVRALLRAAGGRALRIMFPMISVVEEFDQAKEIVERELTYLRQHGHTLPERVDVGTMVEVPALLYQLDELLKRVDFLSVGSNDLFQFLFAVDRGNAEGLRPLRYAVGAGAARAARDRRRRRNARQGGIAVRRNGLAADRRAGAAGDRLSLAVAVADRARPGQGDDPRPRSSARRAPDEAASRCAVGQRLDPRAAARLRRGRRLPL